MLTRICFRAAAALLASWVAAAGTNAQTPTDPIELVKEGRKLNAAGKQAEALELYQRALKIDPALFDAHLAAGVALDLQGDYARARTHLQRAIENAPEGQRAPAVNAMAVSWAFEKKAADAAKYYEENFEAALGTQAYDTAAGVANALGRVYLESGDLDEAAKWYERGYQTSRKLTSLPPDQADLWELRWAHAQSRIAARRGDAAEAARHAATVKAIVDKGGLNAEQLPAYQYLVGYNALYAGQYDAAVADLLKADQRDPFITGLLAQAYEKKGDKARAREYYQLAMQSSGHNLQNAFTRPLARRKLAELK
jgi:tetratricopeptide (TPR) repeat protein